ncbi:hypothetical protein VTN96DRAFT_120 [Rasamsonia emersonii]|uniref:C6 transcription factor n=1 Tax=Rasamsonia emersonii (strain ATCC 16479 / CBS 393.64 / IMI 116815) TaxID=1408163 RepID=A0A0F4YZN3_RASE3|nr:C6 transcription factor [Rasamsonia emersonii CBS 393.64]KKA23575.1 C6 transcription factor [Rasamsonia emersonii CBS 393.64]
MADSGPGQLHAKPPHLGSPYSPTPSPFSSYDRPLLPDPAAQPRAFRCNPILDSFPSPTGASDASPYAIDASSSDATRLSGPVLMPPESESSAAPSTQDQSARIWDDLNALSQTGAREQANAPPVGDQPSYPTGVDAVPEPKENDPDGGNKAANQTVEKEKPPWSELKTKAGKERKRLPLACIACRRKKIRCSGEKPACKHCFRSRIPCVYKVTTRKAAPRTDYMAMLDKRLKRMEERVIKFIPTGETRDMAAIGRAVVKPTPPGQAPKPPKTNQKKRSADEAFAAELEEWTRGNRNPPPSQDTFSLRREAKSLEATGLLTEGAEYLPPMEIQEHLCEVFFECVYGQSYLLLHKPSFMRRLKAGTVPPVLILAVCAVSARFSTHPQLNSEPAFLRGENWANPAAAIALSRHDEPNITILTVFLLLGLHEFGTCHGGRSWSFGGQALRMAYALQLHREVDRDPNGKASELSFVDREIRRRTMWACFLMDRYNSSGSQRPPIGNEKFLHIQLPVKESHFLMEIPGPTEDLDGNVPNPVPEGQGQLSNPKDNMGVSAYIIRAIVVWGHIVDYLNLGGKKKDPYPLWAPESGYMRLKKEIEDFAASLPDFLKFTPENLQNHAAEKIANQFLFLHIIIHQNILFLNQFAVPLSPGGRPPKDMPKSFLSDAGRAAVEAAHHISMLIDRASGYSLTVPFAGYCAYSASTVHIWGIFSKNAQLEARSKEDLRHTYRYLNKMKRYWGMFHYMVESAKDRYRQFADAAIKGPRASNPNGQGPPMFQYGDWFDKYPHGVSRSHWEDPDPSKKKETGDDAVMGQRPDLQSVEDFFASLSPSQKSLQPHKQQKRDDKRESKDSPSDAASMPRQSADFGQPMPAPPQQEPPLMDMLMANAPADFSGFNDPNLFHRAQSFGQPNLDFYFPDHIPQMDRHFVYGSYVGADPAAVMPSGMSMGPNGGVDGQVANGAAGSFWTDPFTPAGTGEFFQPSAWFLPFNLDPGMGATDATAQSGPMQGPGFSNSGNMINSFDMGLTGMGGPQQGPS